MGDRWAIGACVTIAAVALYDRIQAELIDARRRRDDVALDTLSLLKSELVKASKENAAGGKIDDDLVVRLARKAGSAEVAPAIAELKPEGPRGFGLVRKTATARLAGRAEGAQVAAAARKLLG